MNFQEITFPTSIKVQIHILRNPNSNFEKKLIENNKILSKKIAFVGYRENFTFIRLFKDEEKDILEDDYYFYTGYVVLQVGQFISFVFTKIIIGGGAFEFLYIDSIQKLYIK